jgi:hypothetical protein
VLLAGALAIACADDAASVRRGGTGGTSADASNESATGGNAGALPDAGPTDASDDAPDTAADAGSVDFAIPNVLSNLANQSFVPSVAARAGGALVAWHDFEGGDSRVVYSVISGTLPGPLTPLSAETMAGPKRPWVAVIPSGYAIAYQAFDGSVDVLRVVELDPDGNVTSGPDTISPAGASIAAPRMAAAGNQQAFAWLSAGAHHFALRGTENVAPTPVGTTLLAPSQLNIPRIALDASGQLFLAYRDGGTQTSDWDVLLVTRPAGGSFGAPANVSKTPGLLSDDITIAAASDGALDIAWVDQDPVNVSAFEMLHAEVPPGGVPSAPAAYGKQNLSAWTPSNIPGGAAVWSTGAAPFGPMFYSTKTSAPVPILVGTDGGQTSLAQGPDGTLHIAYVDTSTPRRVHYSHSP